MALNAAGANKISGCLEASALSSSKRWPASEGASSHCARRTTLENDSAVRVASTLNHGEFPVGVVTALCGGPFFLILLRRRAA